MKSGYGRENRKNELSEEIQSHIRMDVEARVQAGQTPEEARQAALREFGNIALIEDVTHSFWGWVRLERLLQDIRYVLRSFRRNRGFILMVVGTLAVGIGATSGMFTVVNAVLLRSLPYRNPNQLVDIKESGKRGVVAYGSPYPDIQEWRDRSRSLQAIAYYQANNSHVSFLDAGGAAIPVNAPKVSANLFATLGVLPLLGRGFDESGHTGSVALGDAHSVLLSEGLWRSAFARDAGIVGKAIELNGATYYVRGVMPRGFEFPVGGALPTIWLPIVLGEDDATRIRNVTPDYEVMGRLKPAANVSQAKAELSTLQKEISRAYTDPYDREQVTGAEVENFGASLVRSDLRVVILALLGASSMLWLIACLNVTSLMLARATKSEREIAVRSALGASRGLIIQQFVLEGLLLSGMASVVGLALSYAALRFFERALSVQFNIHERLTPNLTGLLTLSGLTILTALLTSVWPAFNSSKLALEPALREGGSQAGTGRSQERTRRLLVILQIAMSLTLLVGCGLLLRTIYELKHVPLGFRTEHVAVVNMRIPAYKFEGRDFREALFTPLLERAKALPGVQSAALATEVPLGKTFKMQFSLGVSGSSAADVRRRDLRAQFRGVSPELQQVFGLRMARGRFFNTNDTASSQAVLIVNRAFVKEYFGDDRDPSAILGESLLSLDKNRRAVVIGVLEDTRQLSVSDQPQPEIEVCLPQVTPGNSFYRGVDGIAMDLAVRTDDKTGSMIPELHRLISDFSADLTGSQIETMDQVVEDSYGSQKLAENLLLIFGSAALVLSLTGIYGLLSYLVAQRTRELGVRFAMGAQRSDVIWLVLRQAFWMLSCGCCLGLVSALIASASLRGFLYGIKPTDSTTMAVVTSILLLGGVAAACIPAWRAATVDPIKALR